MVVEKNFNFFPMTGNTGVEMRRDETRRDVAERDDTKRIETKGDERRRDSSKAEVLAPRQ